ncbi:MAG: TRAP transporter substrate-binding protein DctP [Deltaproteobacteria bacterium]|nr:TRAP transporter substrate-binding protein DctP [Deltaproteobacteria bacterium]
MKTIKKLLNGIFTTAFIVAIVMFTVTGVCIAESELKIKVSGYFPPENVMWEDFFEMPKKMIEDVTQGRAAVTVYPSNTLIAPKDVYRSLETGLVGFDLVFGPFTPGAFPVTDVFSLPGLVGNQATSNAVLNHVFDKYPVIKKQFSTKVKYIASQVHMRADIHSREPIRTLAELKGKVIGCQNPKIAEALEKLGASVSVIKLATEAYTSLERGVIDGVACAWGSVNVFRLYEVTKYHTLISICPATSHWFFSLKTWNKFTLEEQKRFESLASWFQNRILVGNVKGSMDVRFNKATPAKGHEMIKWSDEDMIKMKKLFRPIWDKWAEEMEEKGYPGKHILRDVELLMDAYQYG